MSGRAHSAPLRRRAGLAVLALALATLTVAAQAGRPCDEQPMPVAAIEQGLALAQRTASALQASGAQVLVLARAGQDLSRYGLRWSHLGLVYRDGPPAGQGGPVVWRVLHKLNHCGSADAALYRQGLGEFFMDSPYRYEAVFVPLAPELQARLLPLLRDNQRAALLSERRYNMVAYPWSTRYQQSNQWAIETLALAAEPRERVAGLGEQGGVDSVTSREQAQAWLRWRGYRPTTLHIDAFTRLGARIGMANVAFDDHPDERRYAGRIDTVSVDSVLAWLQRSGLGQPPVTVR